MKDFQKDRGGKTRVAREVVVEHKFPRRPKQNQFRELVEKMNENAEKENK